MIEKIIAHRKRGKPIEFVFSKAQMLNGQLIEPGFYYSGRKYLYRVMVEALSEEYGNHGFWIAQIELRNGSLVAFTVERNLGITELLLNNGQFIFGG